MNATPDDLFSVQYQEYDGTWHTASWPPTKLDPDILFGVHDRWEGLLAHGLNGKQVTVRLIRWTPTVQTEAVTQGMRP